MGVHSVACPYARARAIHLHDRAGSHSGVAAATARYTEEASGVLFRVCGLHKHEVAATL